MLTGLPLPSALPWLKGHSGCKHWPSTVIAQINRLAGQSNHLGDGACGRAVVDDVRRDIPNASAARLAENPFCIIHASKLRAASPDCSAASR